MKKLTLTLLIVLLCSSLRLPVSAQAQSNHIQDGYTSDGTYYAVYEIETTAPVERAIGDTIDIIRQFRFEGELQPPLEFMYTETINGVTYSGNIKLYGFSIEDGYTLAAYRGRLTAIN